jgi:HSP20 family protein
MPAKPANGSKGERTMTNALIPRFRFGSDLWDDFGRDFDELFSSVFSKAHRGGWFPAVESHVKDGKLEMRVDLPGVNPQEVEVTLDGDELVIRGERKTEERTKGGYSEVRYGSFERRFTVPKGLDADKVTARYENGVLSISAPLPVAAKAGRIPIETAPTEAKTGGKKAA